MGGLAMCALVMAPLIRLRGWLRVFRAPLHTLRCTAMTKRGLCIYAYRPTRCIH